jgi:hypothetical protein
MTTTTRKPKAAPAQAQAEAPADPLAQLTQELHRMNAYLRAIAAANPPGWVRPLGEFKKDWLTAIGAKAYSTDEYGPLIVDYHGMLYGRRSGSGKNGLAIWYSRATGNASYQRLITFKDSAIPQPEGLDRAVANALAKL